MLEKERILPTQDKEDTSFLSVYCVFLCSVGVLDVSDGPSSGMHLSPFTPLQYPDGLFERLVSFPLLPQYYFCRIGVSLVADFSYCFFLLMDVSPLRDPKVCFFFFNVSSSGPLAWILIDHAVSECGEFHVHCA